MAKKKAKRKKKRKSGKDIDRKALIAQKKARARERKGFSSIRNYFRGARTELKKVVWPTRQEVIAASVIVLVVALVTALYIAALDSVFSRLLNIVSAKFTKGF